MCLLQVPGWEATPPVWCSVIYVHVFISKDVCVSRGKVTRTVMESYSASGLLALGEGGGQGSASSALTPTGFLFFKDFIYLFMKDTERGRDPGRGSSRLHAGSPMQDSISGPRGHALD